MMNSTAAFLAPVTLPSTLAARTCAARFAVCATPRAVADGPSRGENGIAETFAPSRRFLAPHIGLHDTGMELVNTVGVVMEPVELDTARAAELLAIARGMDIDDTSALADALFPDAPHMALPMYDTPAADRFFPAARRDDAPVIELTPPGDGEDGVAGLRVTVAKVTAEVPAGREDDPASPRAALADTHPNPAASVVDRFFPQSLRYLAPVIEFPAGALSVGVSMQPVLGEPEAPAFPPETRSVAPKIDIRAPAGDWDTSAFVALTESEVALPIMQALSIGK